MTERSEAQSALDAVRGAQADMVRRATSQGWYHWGLGLLTGVLTLAQAAPLAARLPMVGVTLVGVGLLVQAYRRRTGVWVGGLRPGRTAWVAIAAGLVVGLGQVASLWAGLNGWPALAATVAVGVFAAVTALGYAWDAAYRADMDVSGERDG